MNTSSIIATLSKDHRFITEIMSAMEQIKTPDVLVAELESNIPHIPRLSIIAALNELPTSYGRFITGRRGHPSRFVFAGPRSASIVHPPLTGAPSQPSTNGKTPTVTGQGLVEHRLAIRSDLTVSMFLPSQITPLDVLQLSHYLLGLSIGH